MEIQTHHPIAIANYFIKHSEQGLTLMQVMKLSYIAHGLKLGLGMGPMSEELAEAWKYGPVFPSVYHEFKYEPPGKITALGTDIDEMTPITSNFIDRENNILNLVHDAYGGIEGWKLSALTHKKNTPWYNAYHNGGGKDLRGVTIPNNEIENHFKNEIIKKYEIELS